MFERVSSQEGETLDGHGSKSNLLLYLAPGTGNSMVESTENVPIPEQVSPNPRRWPC
jgi:hypothetical protein